MSVHKAAYEARLQAAYDSHLPLGARHNPRLVRAFASAARMTANSDPTLENIYHAATLDSLLARGPRKSRAMGRAALGPLAAFASMLDETFLAHVDGVLVVPDTDKQTYQGKIAPKALVQAYMERNEEAFIVYNTTGVGVNWKTYGSLGTKEDCWKLVGNRSLAFKPSDLLDRAAVTAQDFWGEYFLPPEGTVYGALLSMSARAT